MTVVDFILANWQLICFIIAILVAVIVLIVKDRKDVVLKMIKVLVTEAEKEFGNGTGSLKLASVIDALYPKLPVSIKTFVPQKVLVKWIETVLITAKEEWNKNNALKDYIAGVVKK
jgi:hypothetical protein